jgi:hypothetical protein
MEMQAGSGLEGIGAAEREDRLQAGPGAGDPASMARGDRDADREGAPHEARD